MKYGTAPEVLDTFDINCQEMMFFMYLPIKMHDALWVHLPKSLEVFRPLLEAVLDNEHKNIENKYMYLTAKNIYATPDNVGNRAGYHSDGFQTEDLNYIWTNKFPTVFCVQDFDISDDCALSMHQMEQQVDKDNEITYPVNTLLKLDQGVIHRTPTILEGGMRTFVKISLSKGKGYWRDGGYWGVDVEIKEGRAYSLSHMEWLNGNRMVEVSEEEWRESNAQYAPHPIHVTEEREKVTNMSYY